MTSSCLLSYSQGRMLDTRGLVIGELAVREKLLSRDQLEDIVAIQEKAKFSQPQSGTPGCPPRRGRRRRGAAPAGVQPPR